MHIFDLSPLHNVTISVDGVRKVLSTLDSSKSCGPDNIPARILKHCCNEIAPILTVIFTQSLNSGNLPDDWLTANITPIFKKGERANSTNYRPILLTSICCKLLEYILYHCITEHLNTTLCIHRLISRLTILYKSLHNLVTLEMPTYVT